MSDFSWSDLGSVGNLISGAADVASGFSVSNKNWQRQKAMIREQMAWEERMSNTAHRREVADLEAAGLNPVLSANSGASTPSAPSGVNPAEYSPLGIVQMQQAFANAKEARATARAAESEAELKEKDLKYWKEHPKQFNEIRRNMVATSRANTQNAIVQSMNNSMDFAYWATHPDEFNDLRYNTVMRAENENLASAAQYAMTQRRNQWEQDHPNLYSLDNMAGVVSAGAHVAGTAGNVYVGGKIAGGMAAANAIRANAAAANATRTIKANKIIIQRRN